MRLSSVHRLRRTAIIALALIVLSALALPFSAQPAEAADASKLFLPLIFKAFGTPKRYHAGQFGYGMFALKEDNAKVKQMGFNWIKIDLSWKVVEGNKDIFYWDGYDKDVNLAWGAGLLILMRVDDPPEWGTNSTQKNAPPIDSRDLGDFMALVAQRYAGRVQAYEIWNEPNISSEWGGQNPNPYKYGQMLQAVYPRIKHEDPNALVVSGGLAITGDGNGSTAYGDLQYLANMLCPGGGFGQACSPSNGYGAYIDAVGSHPYGGRCPPDTSPWSTAANTTCGGTYFGRAEQDEQMIHIWGGVSKPVWATEFGYLLYPSVEGSNYASCDLGPHFNAMEVSAQQQADYLVGAYQYAQAHWPWMGPMFLMDLDFDTTSMWSQCDPIRYFSILEPDGTPLPASNQLSAMPKSLIH